jgi:hypothetical protein
MKNIRLRRFQSRSLSRTAQLGFLRSRSGYEAILSKRSNWFMVKRPVRRPVKFEFEYVTSAVSLLKDDGIVVHVVNDSALTAKSEIVIYQNTGAGAVTATDTGPAEVVPTWTWGLGYTIPQSGEYWLRVLA